MIKKHLRKLKTRLLGDKTRLEKELETVTPAALGVGFEPGEDDQAEEVEELSSRVAVAELIRERLKNIKIALTKMSKRTYGICENCGKKIELELLEVSPESKLCKKCKQKLHG